MNSLKALATLLQVVLMLIAFNTLAIAQEQTEQEVELLLKKISALELEIKIKTDSLISSKEQLKLLEQKKFLSDQSEKAGGFTLLTTIKFDANVYESTYPPFIKLFNVSAGDTVRLTDYFKGYWLVNKESLYGYVNDLFVNENIEITRFKSALEEKNADYNRKKQLEYTIKDKAISDSLRLENEKKSAELEKKLTAQRAELEKKLTVKFGSKVAKDLVVGRVWMGMTEEMAEYSWGRPQTINRSVGSWGVSEQWVYGVGNYLYFGNGKLTSWQTSN